MTVTLPCAVCGLLTQRVTIRGKTRNDAEPEYAGADCDCAIDEAEKDRLEDAGLEAALCP